jgi:hypothetical protein
VRPGSGPVFAGPGRSGCSTAQPEPIFGAGHGSATSTLSTSSTAASTSTSASGTPVDSTMIANNFNTFLQLLTTQLQNQNPLDPSDTNPPLLSIGGQTNTMDKMKHILQSN